MVVEWGLIVENFRHKINGPIGDDKITIGIEVVGVGVIVFGNVIESAIGIFINIEIIIYVLIIDKF